MYQIVMPVFGLWCLVLLEAVAFAAVPAAIAWAISANTANAWATTLAVFSVAVSSMVARMSLDTRVYTKLWRTKIIELFEIDRDSARAKASRWNDALKRLESLGPQILRGGADIVTAMVYTATINGTLAWLTLLASVPCILAGYWVTTRMTTIAASLNSLALKEAELYANGTVVTAIDYYLQQYKLIVQESDVDATGYVLGGALLWVLRFGSLYVLQQQGVAPAVLFALLMYNHRFAEGLDRVTVGMRNLAVILTIIKV